MLRLFIGLELPEAVRLALAALRRPMAGTRWVAPENLHLTLRFLGELDGPVAREVDEVLEGLVADAFDLEIRAVGQFGSARGSKLLWAGLAPNDQLARLAGAVDRALQRVDEVALRDAAFHAHITLARLKAPPADRVAEFLAAGASLRIPPVRVETFTLFSSRLTPDGAQYRAEADYRLGPARQPWREHG
ncbi:MAG: RNA 2',3'-cyclic phosphodiesterase [Alphaproteobacteria bacterium]|nr:RNA 2',3'-cyclic phosphodiesterase [Alphaproteobacteria bacterium]